MRHAVAVAVVLLLAAGTVSGATFLTAPTDRELVDRADTVVVGRVVSVSAREAADRMIYTDSALEIDEVLKGNLTGNTITISEAGGFAHGHGVIIAGSASYAAGSRVVAFLRHRDDGTFFTA